MISQRILASLPRSIAATSKRRILSAAFSAENEWANRHQELKKLGLGGEYEWISTVQKKFIGGGIASAVDVDAATCIAEHKDQVNDVVDLVYKLRHTENAGDMLPSTEYALIKLLLKHEPELLLKLAEDSINYGVFMNEHAACLAIDFFIKRDRIQEAARLAAWVMLQEMTENELLNLLVLYTCSRWAELPKDQQISAEEEKQEEAGDEEKTVKFPYLKNPHFDNHFDLVVVPHLVGKTLLWVSRDCKSIEEGLRKSLSLLGAVLYEKFDDAGSLASSSIDGSIAAIIQERLTPAEGTEIPKEHQNILDGLNGCKKGDKSISEILLDTLNKLKDKEESELTRRQKEEFIQWNKRRQDLVSGQAEKLLIKIRSEEIEKEMKDIEKQHEKLFFFENRLKWEKKAAENKEIDEQYAESKKKSVAST